jgi:hypothetical protein
MIKEIFFSEITFFIMCGIVVVCLIWLGILIGKNLERRKNER